jgi:phosphopantothenoylcysteine decarboxylase/phosphopantothenate--cysteine ligase
MEKRDASFCGFNFFASGARMSFLSEKTVGLGVGGGIAVYRVCELARLLIKRGAAVRVVMTANAQEFVTPLTFQALTGNPVRTGLFNARSDSTFGHLEIGRMADLFIVAPATANLIARIRTGMADDSVTSSVLSSQCRVLIAPAMNYAMWENPLTQENVQALLAHARFSLVGPVAGMLAEGVEGMGRLAEPIDILEAAESLLAPKDFEGWRVVVTAGPTREPLDPVRFLSNPSSGRMGYAVARAAAQRGARVLLISGPSQLPTPRDVELRRVTTAQEMAREALAAVREANLFIAAAAVSDYQPECFSSQKIKKKAGSESITFIRTPDVLAQCVEAASQASPRNRPIFVGFAAETEHILDNAREKLVQKKLDLIAANDIHEEKCGFAEETNQVTLITRNNQIIPLPKDSKQEIAHQILDQVIGLGQVSGSK